MKNIRHVSVLLMVLIFFILLPQPVMANSAEPPSLTILVINPPADLTLSLRLTDGTETKPLQLSKEIKAWEAYYRFCLLA